MSAQLTKELALWMAAEVTPFFEAIVSHVSPEKIVNLILTDYIGQ
jgi:hypothetical protein